MYPKSSRVGDDADRPGKARGDAFDHVLRQLRQAIVSGQLRPGERIQQEAIAERLGTSRLPVRDALRELQREGLVTLERNRGARVTALSGNELAEIYLLRERLEPALVAASASRLEDGAIAELWELVDEMERVGDPDGDVGAWLALDRRFHFTAYSGAPMPRLKGIVESYWNLAAQYYRAYSQLSYPVSFHLSHLEHRLLAESLADQRAVDAELILRMHIRRTFQSLAADAGEDGKP